MIENAKNSFHLKWFMIHGFLLLEKEWKRKRKTKRRFDNKKEIFCASFEMDFSLLLFRFFFLSSFQNVFIKIEKRTIIIFDLLWSIEKNLKVYYGYLWKIWS